MSLDKTINYSDIITFKQAKMMCSVHHHNNIFIPK